LKAGLNITPHSETVRRVLQILEDLGDDAATVRKRRGEKRIVFDEDLVRRIERQQAHDGVRTALTLECEERQDFARTLPGQR
jgi:hypothetical protein